MSNSYPFALVVHLDIETEQWVVCVGPYATQGRTLLEAFVSAHDLIHGVIAVCDEHRTEIPFGFPLIFESLEKFRKEI